MLSPLMGKSASLPMLPGMRSPQKLVPPEGMARFARHQSLAHTVVGQVDRKRPVLPSTEEIGAMIQEHQAQKSGGQSPKLRRAGSAILRSESDGNITFGDGWNQRTAPGLRMAPTWLRNDRMVLRFYAYFQEPVVEHQTECSRFRPCAIFFYLEDGTMSAVEEKIPNSGLSQGTLVKRHVVPKDPEGLLKAGSAGGIRGPECFFGPEDLRLGTEIVLYSKRLRIINCDPFTRAYYAAVGLEVGEAEEMPSDSYAEAYARRMAFETGQMPMPKELRESKLYNEICMGGSRGNAKLEQFLKNDRKVLRFNAYWDDMTRYGVRNYYVLHYFLADNTIEINEHYQRNSGKWETPVFYKRAPLHKNPEMFVTPGMTSPELEIYRPEDLRLGQDLSVYGRPLRLYDCDDFTQEFYREFMELEQVSEPILPELRNAVRLEYPPHIGIGSEEDSLGSCLHLRPQLPKQDITKLMANAGKILRFEAKMHDPSVEDVDRRFIVGIYLMDDSVAVWEMRSRNSGFAEGKFADRARRKNPETGAWYQPKEIYVGALITVSGVKMQVVRADEYSLNTMEAMGAEQFPMSDIATVAWTIRDVRPYIQNRALVEVDELRELALTKAQVGLTDQELITLLRKCGGSQNQPKGQKGPGPAALIMVEPLLAEMA